MITKQEYKTTLFVIASLKNRSEQGTHRHELLTAALTELGSTIPPMNIQDDTNTQESNDD